jgi:beta-galactosidase
VFIDFDGVYMNSDVWINGHHLGHRPYGYISFRYELTPYLNFGEQDNVIAVKVDNSLQPNSRWYSGCGIYRNVWLVQTNPVHIENWGTYVTTPEISDESAVVRVKTTINNSSDKTKMITLKSIVLDADGKKIAEDQSDEQMETKKNLEVSQTLNVKNPQLWSVKSPQLYSLVSHVFVDGNLVDDVTTPFGIRYFEFDAEDGFSLNGEPTPYTWLARRQKSCYRPIEKKSRRMDRIVLLSP